jgi:hypothetical protein
VPLEEHRLVDAAVERRRKYGELVRLLGGHPRGDDDDHVVVEVHRRHLVFVGDDVEAEVHLHRLLRGRLLLLGDEDVDVRRRVLVGDDVEPEVHIHLLLCGRLLLLGDDDVDVRRRVLVGDDVEPEVHSIFSSADGSSSSATTTWTSGGTSLSLVGDDVEGEVHRRHGLRGERKQHLLLIRRYGLGGERKQRFLLHQGLRGERQWRRGLGGERKR